MGVRKVLMICDKSMMIPIPPYLCSIFNPPSHQQTWTVFSKICWNFDMKISSWSELAAFGTISDIVVQLCICSLNILQSMEHKTYRLYKIGKPGQSINNDVLNWITGNHSMTFSDQMSSIYFSYSPYPPDTVLKTSLFI